METKSKEMSIAERAKKVIADATVPLEGRGAANSVYADADNLELCIAAALQEEREACLDLVRKTAALFVASTEDNEGEEAERCRDAIEKPYHARPDFAKAVSECMAQVEAPLEAKLQDWREQVRERRDA
jgi:hypothetical protein